MRRGLSAALETPQPAAEVSWSQEGEDRVLAYLFHAFERPGIFVDVGALHPTRLSNTALASSRGWRGINIDAGPGSMEAFRAARPRDVNIELGVAESEQSLNYYAFEEPALSTFDTALAMSRRDAGSRIVSSATVQCRRLSSILDEHLADISPDRTIDFMTVDAEGLDLQVLRSNDWQRYRPLVVVVEISRMAIADAMTADVAAFLAGRDYVAFSKFVNSAIFVRADWLAQRFPQP